MQTRLPAIWLAAFAAALLASCSQRNETEPAATEPAATMENEENAPGTTTTFEEQPGSEEQTQPPAQ